MKYKQKLVTSTNRKQFEDQVQELGQQDYYIVSFQVVAIGGVPTFYALMEKEIPSDSLNNLPKPPSEQPVE